MTDYLTLNNLLAEAGISFTPVASTQAPVLQKRRFLLVGTHAHQTTGYSKVTYHIVQELAKHPNIETFHFGFQKFMAAPTDYRSYPAGVDVYDPASVEKSGTAPQEMGFGFSQLPAYVRKVKPDVILIDDTQDVIDDFNAAGGIGILHKDIRQTIRILQEVLDTKEEILYNDRVDKTQHIHVNTNYTR
jgi:hypothetical protein